MVKFSTKNEKWLFNDSDPVTDFMNTPEKTIAAVQFSLSLLQEDPEEDFVESVWHKRYKDLIEVLKAGCAC